MRIASLLSPADPRLPDWLDLFELSFPPAERVLASTFLRALSKGKADPSHTLLAGTEGEGGLVAMAHFQIFPAQRAAYLWYLAVAPDRRGAGLGSEMYRAVLERLPASVAAMLIEVEPAQRAHGEQDRRLAERRVVFYRRLGARQLLGIDYLQTVGTHQPVIPMDLLVHLRGSLTPEAVYRAVHEICGDLIRQTGPLAFGPSHL